MTAQQLQLITQLMTLLAPVGQQAISALLAQAGIDSSKLLEMAQQNNETALTMIQAEINRVGANVPPATLVPLERLFPNNAVIVPATPLVPLEDLLVPAPPPQPVVATLPTTIPVAKESAKTKAESTKPTIKK